jgi:transcription-repair coupling factor (superfamily II helicase)
MEATPCLSGERSEEGLALRVSELIDRARNRERTLRLLRVRGSAGPYLISRLRGAHPGPLLVVSPTSRRAERFASDLQVFAPDSDTRVFPRYDTPPFDRFSPHPEIEARRMSLLYRLLASDAETRLTLVAPWSALMRRVLPRAELRGRVTRLERGMTIDRDALLEVLVAAGYHHAGLVEERGEVASRGGILDLFPPQLDRPLRVEFEFDEIGSIRRFDPVTQRSEEELRECVAIPPRPYRIPADSEELLQRVRALGRQRSMPESVIYEVTEALGRRHAPPGIENLEALLHDGSETLFDYLPPGTLAVVEDPEAGATRALEYTQEIFTGHARAEAQDRLLCDPLSLYVTDTDAADAVRALRPLLLDGLGSVESGDDEERIDLAAADHAELRREVQGRLGSGRALEPLATRISSWLENGERVRIVCPSLSAADRMVDLLREYGLELPILRAADAASAALEREGGDGSGESGGNGSTGRAWSRLPEQGSAEIAVAPLATGFVLPHDRLVVVSEEDVFGERVHRRPTRTTRRGQAIDRLAQIEEGDFLVHAEHGVGAYGGLVQLDLGGVTQEFLLVRYRDEDKLYLPVSRLAHVQRYTGHDGPPPALDRLGGQVWARAKKRAQRAVRDMARELLAVHAAREVLERPAYPPPGRDYEEFEAGFPYDDTPDQRRATEEVLADLQREQPMDRVVCGDVGFGKTEVACRATYQVASEGRQVAFLVPTTVLCQQHAKTLEERFAHTAIEVASISRFSTPKRVREVREGLASGRIDVVVGTHRLLSKDVRFRNLGLLVIDEEHRFGVAHKERLKQLRKLVDTLTLTATPIPRTLQMALSGLRNLSVINTPPPDRLSVRTQVCRFEDEVVSEAIRRELRRGGQVFFVHNRVETIAEIGRYVQSVVPDAKVRIAHGQMAAHELEQAMVGFLNRDWNVLVCTAIIESGLDIPNANTILIHRSDQFGLAQLYQLRGRVGRSDRRAYAYLFLPPAGKLSDDARRRLEAIQDLSELGSGFRLATNDLEIRGAGNLLGSEQSGQVAAVGYDLYMEMLEEAIAEMRGEAVRREVEPEIRLPIPALLPEAYVANVSQRLVLYKQLSSARDEAEVRDVRADLLDRFGPLPPEAQNLLDVIRLKIRCRDLGIASAETKGSELVLQVSDRPRIEPRQLMRLIDQPDSPYRVSPDHRIYLRLRRTGDVIAEATGLLELLSPADAAAAESAA